MRRLVLLILTGAVLGAGASAVAQQGAPPSQAVPVVGGGSFNAAPELKPGVYADTIVPAETTFYRVKVPEGRRVTASVEVDLSALSTDPDDPTFSNRLNALLYQLNLFTPLRQRVQLPGSGQLDSGEGKVATGSLEGPVAQPLGRALTGGPEFTGPGDWYVAVNVTETLGESPVSAELPIELRIEVGP